MFENLTERLSKSLRTISGRGRLTEENIKETLREVRMALLEADVALPVVKEFVNRVKERAVGQEVSKSLSPGQAFIKIVQGELVSVMGEANESLDLATQPPAVLLMAGLQGAGKTTFAGKLANKLIKEENARPMMIAADIYRPAAIDQLKVWADRAGATMIRQEMGSDPASVAFDTLKSAVANKADVVLIDTAGRLHNKVGLMNELTKIRNVMGKVIPNAPQEVMLVLDGSTGQNAFEQARQFTQATQVTSLTITKLDGTAKGGVVTAIARQCPKPIRFIGVGEQIDDLRPFSARDFVDALFE